MTDQEAYDRNLRAAERAHDLTDDLGKRLMDASTKDAQEAIKSIEPNAPQAMGLPFRAPDVQSQGLSIERA
jgi:hypothetical protein